MILLANLELRGQNVELLAKQTWTVHGILWAGWPKLRHVSGGLPVLGLQLKSTPRKAVDPLG